MYSQYLIAITPGLRFKQGSADAKKNRDAKTT
jgi:hypothetical protein